MTRPGSVPLRRPPPAPPPLPPAQQGSGRAHLATDRFAFWVLVLGQCFIWASVMAQAETWVARMQPALVALLTSLGLLASTLAPRFYWRHR